MNKSTVLAFLDAEIERLQRAKELLSGADGAGSNGSYGHPRKLGGIRRRRRMSAEARRKISIAQKKRWAARKKGQ